MPQLSALSGRSLWCSDPSRADCGLEAKPLWSDSGVLSVRLLQRASSPREILHLAVPGLVSLPLLALVSSSSSVFIHRTLRSSSHHSLLCVEGLGRTSSSQHQGLARPPSVLCILHLLNPPNSLMKIVLTWGN